MLHKKRKVSVVVFACAQLFLSMTCVSAEENEKFAVYIDFTPLRLRTASGEDLSSELLSVRKSIQAANGKRIATARISSELYGLEFPEESEDRLMVYQEGILGFLMAYPGGVAGLEIIDCERINDIYIQALFRIPGLESAVLVDMEKITSEGLANAVNKSGISGVMVSRCKNVRKQELGKLIEDKNIRITVIP